LGTPSKQSYKITLNNNLTEKEAINYVMNQDKHLCNPSKEARLELLDLFNLLKSFSRAFDLIHTPQEVNGQNMINLSSKEDITFIELKTIKKHSRTFQEDFSLVLHRMNLTLRKYCESNIYSAL